MKLTQTTSHS